MPNEAPYGHGCPPEPFAGKASKYRIYGPESAKAGGWAARPGDAIPQPGHRGQAAAKKTSLPKAAENSEDRKGPAPCRKNKGQAAAKKVSLPKAAKIPAAAKEAHPPKVAKTKTPGEYRAFSKALKTQRVPNTTIVLPDTLISSCSSRDFSTRPAISREQPTIRPIS